MFVPQVKIVADDPATVAPWYEYARKLWLALPAGGRLRRMPEERVLIEVTKDPDSILLLQLPGPAGIATKPLTGDQPTYLHLLQGEVIQPVLPTNYGTDTTGDKLQTADNRYLFPLVDTELTSYLLSDAGGGDLAGTFLGQSGLFGNQYWHNGDTANLTVLSYKGRPTRHFPALNDGLLGLSDTDDHVFGYAIYQGGSVLTMAPKGAAGGYLPIYGAALCGGTLVCLAGGALYTCASGLLDTDKGSPWALVPGAQVKSDQWFFDTTGKQAVSSSGDALILSDDLLSYAYTPYLAPQGQFFIGHDGTLQAQSEPVKLYHEFRDGVVACATYQEAFTSASDFNATSDSHYDPVPHYAKFLPDTVIITAYYNGILCAAPARSDGTPTDYPNVCGNPTVTWTGPVDPLPDNPYCAKIQSDCSSTTGTFTVTATISATGFSAQGQTQVQIAGKPGYWQLVSQDFSGTDWAHQNFGGAYFSHTETIITQTSQTIRTWDYTAWLYDNPGGCCVPGQAPAPPTEYQQITLTSGDGQATEYCCCGVPDANVSGGCNLTGCSQSTCSGQMSTASYYVFVAYTEVYQWVCA